MKKIVLSITLLFSTVYAEDKITELQRLVTPKEEVAQEAQKLNDATVIENTTEDKSKNDAQSEPQKKEVVTEAQNPQNTTITKNETIEIRNSIKPDMLTFKNFWYGTFKPKELAQAKDTKLLEVQVRVNDKIVKPNESMIIEPSDGTIKVCYDYNFMVRKKDTLVSKRKGAKEVTFAVETDTKKLDMSFSWDNKFRVIFDKATPDPNSVQTKEPSL